MMSSRGPLLCDLYDPPRLQIRPLALVSSMPVRLRMKTPLVELPPGIHALLAVVNGWYGNVGYDE